VRPALRWLQQLRGRGWMAAVYLWLRGKEHLGGAQAGAEPGGAARLPPLEARHVCAIWHLLVSWQKEKGYVRLGFWVQG